MFSSMFNQSSRLLLTKNFTKLNSSIFRSTFRSTKSFRSLPLLFGSTGSLVLFHTYHHNFIHNDTAVLSSSPVGEQIHSNVTVQRKKIHSSRFGGALNYQELSIGSITGLFLGIIVGKLSSAIVFLSLSSYFLIQFLESRNIISIPWNSVINLGSNKINVKELLLHKPSFKISFVLSFLIAAYNI